GRKRRDRDQAQPGYAADGWPAFDPRQRCLGARLLSQLPEPPARLPQGLVERGQLAKGEPALRRRQGRRARYLKLRTCPGRCAARDALRNRTGTVPRSEFGKVPARAFGASGTRFIRSTSERAGDPEADLVVAIAGVEAAVGCGAQQLRRVVPGSSAQHPATATAGDARPAVRRRPLQGGGGLPAVLDPFIDVAVHLIEPERIRLE